MAEKSVVGEQQRLVDRLMVPAEDIARLMIPPEELALTHARAEAVREQRRQLEILVRFLTGVDRA